MRFSFWTAIDIHIHIYLVTLVVGLSIASVLPFKASYRALQAFGFNHTMDDFKGREGESQNQNKNLGDNNNGIKKD